MPNQYAYLQPYNDNSNDKETKNGPGFINKPSFCFGLALFTVQFFSHYKAK